MTRLKTSDLEALLVFLGEACIPATALSHPRGRCLLHCAAFIPSDVVSYNEPDRVRKVAI